jgi:hypothetical protein
LGERRGSTAALAAVAHRASVPGCDLASPSSRSHCRYTRTAFTGTALARTSFARIAARTPTASAALRTPRTSSERSAASSSALTARMMIVTTRDDCDQRHEERDGSASSNPSTERFV